MAKAIAATVAKTDPFQTTGGPRMESGRALLSKFKPYPDNPRTHPKEEIALLSRLIKTRGADQPIVVDEDWFILKGHGRREAAALAKLKDFPYVQRFGLSDAEKRAMRIEDNQLALLAGWDQGLLRAEASKLKLAGYDMPLLGFSDTMTTWLTSGGELVMTPMGEWGGMPEFQQDDKTAFRSIVVHFKDQEAVDAFAKVTKQKINEKTRFLWYPEIEIEPFVKVRSTGAAADKSKGRKK